MNTILVLAVSATTKREADTRSWDWVEGMVWTERMLAALDNGVQGGRWYSLMDKGYALPTLRAAWEQVQANQGADGVDRMTVERFEAQAERYLTELHGSLKAGTYRPEPVRRVYVPKPGGGERPLGIPTVKDRIVQTALLSFWNPSSNGSFSPRVMDSGRDGGARTPCGRWMASLRKVMGTSWTRTSRATLIRFPRTF